MKYHRVLPRDLFNEAKLLKCIGRLVLLIHDMVAPEGIAFEHWNEETPFQIKLHEDGHLEILNIKFSIHNHKVIFRTTYNSKSNYPLHLYYDYCEYTVFDENGNFDEEFLNFFKNEAKDIRKLS